MSSRSLLVVFGSRSTVLANLRVECQKANRYSLHSMSGLSSNKSVKDMETKTKLWTNKEHEEWVDRIFGPLKRPQTARKEDNGSAGTKKTTQ